MGILAPEVTPLSSFFIKIMVQVDQSHYESPSERITNKKTSIKI